MLSGLRGDGSDALHDGVGRGELSGGQDSGVGQVGVEAWVRIGLLEVVDEHVEEHVSGAEKQAAIPGVV